MSKKTAHLQLENGEFILAEIEILSGEQEIALTELSVSFQEFSNLISKVAENIKTSIDKAKPDKATVEFGISLGLEAGQLTALIVKGTGEANLKVTLEWT